MKPLYDEFLRDTQWMLKSITYIWRWLRKGQLKNETQGLITAAQDQELRTKTIK